MSIPVVTLGLLGSLAAGWVVVLLLAPARRGDGPPVAASVHRLRRIREVTVARFPAVAGAALAGLLAYVVLGLVAPALVIATLGWGAAAAFRRWRESHRSALLGAALLSATDLLAQLLPAGHSTRQSLVVLAESGPTELRAEIARILARVNEVPLEDALIEAQERMRQPLFTLIAAALTVGNRSGGRLAPLLQELSRAAHQIDAVQGQLRAEQAQGRLGALVIATMPIGLLAMLHLVNPDYLAPYATVRGELLLGGLLSLIVLGYLWMVRILRLPQPDVLPLAPQAVMADAHRIRPRVGASADPLDGGGFAVGTSRTKAQRSGL
ncbi:MAG: type II secretion system F family protein [Candidatus Dormiibacterota bacterium]